MSRKKILVVRQDKLGDSILCTPLLKALGDLGHLVHVLSPALNHRAMAGVGGVVCFETSYKPSTGEYLGIASQLRAESYDIALLLKEDSGAHSVICRLAGIPVRVGMTRKWYRSLLTHEALSDVEGRHEVERNLKLGSMGLGESLPLGPLVFPNPDEGALEAAELLAKIGLEGDFAIVHPMTGGTSSAVTAEVVEGILACLLGSGLRVLLTGSAQDFGTLEGFARAGSVVNLAGLTSLPGLYALQKRAKLVVSANTGAMHLAAAAGASVVMLETTPPADWRIKRWHPWGVEYRAVDLTSGNLGDVQSSLASILNRLS